ncbi:MAG: redox-regulated ATPase YchF [Candidatus Cloacimonetes bacterium]|nr:redox-regulated ATPase YchF [Candidatus Cloacimonadota bacterium]
MKLGILGLQNSGKTTIFNALTGQDIETASFTSGKIEPNLGLVNVVDARITKLSEIYNPQKTIYANIEYIDFAGLSGNESGGFPSNLLALLKTTDAIVLVVRNFEDEIISGVLGVPDVLGDIEKIKSELIISDLIIAEKRLQNIELSQKRGIKDQSLLIEKNAIIKILDGLNSEIPVRKLEFSKEEKKAIKGFQFITQKPILVIVNSDETNFGNNGNLLKEIEKQSKVAEFAGNFEMELNNLSNEDAKEFMSDIGISESAQNRITKLSYELLGYISFFTVGTDEVRAWTIQNGDNAVDAAGTIHSDLARGFIRAECFSYEDLVNIGDEKKIREKGLFRLEGKNYLLKDGDILNIRFSV